MGQNNVSIFTNIVQSKQVGETTSEQNTSQLAYLDLSCLHENIYFSASPSPKESVLWVEPLRYRSQLSLTFATRQWSHYKAMGTSVCPCPNPSCTNETESQISQACASQWLDWREFFHTYIVCECECVWPNGRENDKVIYTLSLSLSLSHIDSLPYRSQLPMFKPSQSQTELTKQSSPGQWAFHRAFHTG